MKKVFLLSSVIAVVALSSCKKDYTCTCKDSSGNVYGSVTIKDTKSKATSACTADNSTYAAYGINITCSIQ